jgi:hypothetical protein
MELGLRKKLWPSMIYPEADPTKPMNKRSEIIPGRQRDAEIHQFK